VARLTMRQRRRLPASDYAIPERAPGPGSYPIEDEGHRRAALGEVAAHGSPWERRRVRRAVAHKRAAR
jgi:hypothetical protein